MVGFNSNQFDLPFLIRRSWKHNVAVPMGIRRGRYWSDQVLDLRDVWQLAGFNRVRRCQVLVIDEVSMLPGRQFEFVEFLFRHLRVRDEPFGGCQVIATGDFLQLPPVRTDETQRYDWAFLSPAWASAEFKTIILETVRRQDEPAFVKALGNFRVGRVWGDTARLLQSRVRSNPAANMPRLFTHNLQVDKWNNFQLGGLPGDDIVLEAEQSGPDHQREFLTKNLLTPATLRLKPGALVMFTVNRAVPGSQLPLFVNGQMGAVEAIRPGAVVVRSKGSGLGCDAASHRFAVKNIVKLTAENVKRIRAVEISPQGNLVVIGGRNAQGKSSVLDAILYGLGGAKMLPDVPVRRGMKALAVGLDLGELVVTRTRTAAGSATLVVKPKAGKPLGSPQAVLDKLTGGISFDPLNFTRLLPHQQAETLRQLAGLDFTTADAAKQKLYDERLVLGRELKAAEARLDATIPCDNGVPDTEVSAAEILVEQSAAAKKNAENGRLRRAAGSPTRLVRHRPPCALMTASAAKDSNCAALKILAKAGIEIVVVRDCDFEASLRIIERVRWKTPSQG